MSQKILIIHDRFQFRGGAERLILILAKALNADLMTEFWTEESFEIPNYFNPPLSLALAKTGQKKLRPFSSLKDKDTTHLLNKLEKEVNNKQRLYILSKGEAPWIVWRYFRAHFNFLFKTRKIVRQYETIIFSGNNCLTAAFNCKRTTKKILYCHSPVRHVFDLWQHCRSEQTKKWKRIIYYDIGAWLIRFIYWLGLKKMNVVIANSENIKKRLEDFCHQKVDQVIYPPIETDKFKWLGQGDYYLSFGRVERLKRIPDIIRAFQRMPDKKLVVVSGGPDLEKVRKMSNGYRNIKITGWVGDKELKEYVGRCIASIYIPINEDFGMTPLESMSAGKPCIGVYEGGLKETIIDGVNGKFIPQNYTLDDLVAAVKWMAPEQALAMRENCEKQAKKFSQEKFVERIRQIIK